MNMPGRKYDAGSGYRYGFNGKEKDKDISEGGQDYGMRIYDGRLGRFLSVDPLTKTFPYYSPYHYASNSPIKFTDLDGGEPKDYLQNWIPQSLFEMKSGKMVGDGSYMQVWVQSQPQLGMIDVKLIYDKSTKQLWFIHSDDQGNYYYLKNANNESGVMHIAPGKHKNFVRGGEFAKFETQNAIQARLSGELATAMATTVFAAAAAIASAFAIAGTVAALTPQATILYGTYAAPAANVVNNYVVPLLDESGQAGNAGVGAATSVVERKLLDASTTAVEKTVKHHIFNVFRGSSPASQKYRDFFKNLNINVDDHTVEISEGLHKYLHRAGNNWTTQWKKWIDANPNATAKDVYQQAGKMMDDAGINHVPIGQY